MSVRRYVGTLLQWVLARVRRTPPLLGSGTVFPVPEGIPARLINILWLSCG